MGVPVSAATALSEIRGRAAINDVAKITRFPLFFLVEGSLRINIEEYDSPMAFHLSEMKHTST